MKRRALPVLSIAVLLVTAGCLGLSGGGDGASPDGGNGQPKPAQIREQAVQAMQDVKTYRMNMSMTISANDQEITMTQRGVFDHAEKQARLNMTLFGRNVTAYLDGTTMYLKAGSEWRTRDLSSQDPWKQGRALARQKKILASANVSVAGSETVNGVQTTVLLVKPNEDELKRLIAQQQGRSFENVEIKEVTYRMYVANDTRRLRKMEMSMTMTVNGRTTEVSMTATFSEYGEPVDVTIPDAATQSERHAQRGSGVVAFNSLS